jgi:hypothetical protein
MKTRWVRLLWILLVVLVLGFGYVAVRAHLMLVTLKVRNADLREVIRKIEWQTWSIILVHQEVRGWVTLDVRNAHLEEVLSLIAQQTGSRWLVLYPLYSSGKSLSVFKQAARGEITAEAHGWTNLSEIMSFSPGGSFAHNNRRSDERITLSLTNRELHLATLALSRFGNIEVVPEDGVPAQVSLRLNQVPANKAVKQLAQKVNRNSAAYYSLQSQHGPMPMPGVAPLRPIGDRNRAAAGENKPPIAPPAPQRPPKEQEQKLEQEYQALCEILPPEQRAELEQERRFHENLRALPPGQHMQYLQQAAGSTFSELQQQRLNDLKTTTPEQRVNRDREDEQRRQSTTR